MSLCHNARIKRYPDGSGELLIGSRPFGGGNISRLPAFLDDGDPRFIRMPCRPETADMQAEREYAELERDAVAWEDSRASNAAQCHAAALMRSARRARKAVRDIARSNDWAYFVTLTLDPEKVDRYSFSAIWKHLRHWLGNNVRRKGLTYLLVPEYHKDGAIHFHGLFNDALEAVDSGTMSIPGRKAPVRVRSAAQKEAFERMGGHTVYNLPGWGWGFSTAIQLYGERDAAINYVCKYIGKDLAGEPGSDAGTTPAKIGGRWYYSGGALQRPTVEWFDVDLQDWEHVPGWYRPEEYPFAMFLTLRVTAAGEILPPYTREGGTTVLPEGNAEHGRGGDQPPQEGVPTAPGPSSDHAEEQVVDLRSRVSSSRPGHASHAALTATRPCASLGDLTFSGLSSGRQPAAGGGLTAAAAPG